MLLITISVTRLMITQLRHMSNPSCSLAGKIKRFVVLYMQASGYDTVLRNIRQSTMSSLQRY